jgi:methylated-DNA-[protein]-cysteine S-methyltransferase
MRRTPSVCREIERDLLALAMREAEPPAAQRVEEHIGRCAPCRNELERYRAVDGMVDTLRSEALPATHVGLAREELESRLADLRRRFVAYRVFRSPLGHILIARSEEGVSLVEYLGTGTSLKASRCLGRGAGVEAVEDGEAIETLYRQLLEYLEGKRSRLDWPLDLRFARSEFHRAVLRATAGIPYGAVTSYAAIASQVGKPSGVRAVAQALRWNPVPIIVPCHRVISATGLLTGYAGNKITLKRRLLSVEGIRTVKAERDFRVAREAMYVSGDESYCLPTCPSLASARVARLTLFGSRQRAEAVGLQPCTTCRPDLHPISQ